MEVSGECARERKLILSEGNSGGNINGLRLMESAQDEPLLWNDDNMMLGAAII